MGAEQQMITSTLLMTWREYPKRQLRSRNAAAQASGSTAATDRAKAAWTENNGEGSGKESN